MNPPKLISEIQSKGWLNSMFNTFEFEKPISPKFEFHQGLYTHKLETSDEVKFDTFKARNFSVYQSQYFKNFSIEFNTDENKVFTHQDEYCINEKFTRINSWHHNGKRMSSYYYITEKTISGLILTKQTENNIGVILSHSTILKEEKRNIDINLKLTGNLNISNRAIKKVLNEYSDYSTEQLASLEKWKNIELSKKTQLIQNRMNNWIENLYECSVEESENKIRLIYVTKAQKRKLQEVVEKSKKGYLNLEGEFRMFDDYSAILKSISKLEQVKHE